MGKYKLVPSFTIEMYSALPGSTLVEHAPTFTSKTALTISDCTLALQQNAGLKSQTTEQHTQLAGAQQPGFSVVDFTTFTAYL